MKKTAKRTTTKKTTTIELTSSRCMHNILCISRFCSFNWILFQLCIPLQIFPSIVKYISQPPLSSQTLSKYLISKQYSKKLRKDIFQKCNHILVYQSHPIQLLPTHVLKNISYFQSELFFHQCQKLLVFKKIFRKEGCWKALGLPPAPRDMEAFEIRGATNTSFKTFSPQQKIKGTM